MVKVVFFLMTTMPQFSLQEEVDCVNSLMSTSENSDEFIRSFKVLGYTKERDIVKLFIRTSVTIQGLICKLIKAGFDINCSVIGHLKFNRIRVIIPSLDKKSSINVVGFTRT